jgi:hypothetical protein
MIRLWLNTCYDYFSMRQRIMTIEWRKGRSESILPCLNLKLKILGRRTVFGTRIVEPRRLLLISHSQKTTTTRLHIAYLLSLSTFKILRWFLQKIYFHPNRASFRNVGFRFTQGCRNNDYFVCFPKCGSRAISYFVCRTVNLNVW